MCVVPVFSLGVYGAPVEYDLNISPVIVNTLRSSEKCHVLEYLVYYYIHGVINTFTLLIPTVFY